VECVPCLQTRSWPKRVRQRAIPLWRSLSWHFLVPNCDSAVNPFEQRGLSFIQRLLQELSELLVTKTPGYQPSR
jgi:hypothetical protein